MFPKVVEQHYVGEVGTSITAVSQINSYTVYQTLQKSVIVCRN